MHSQGTDEDRISFVMDFFKCKLNLLLNGIVLSTSSTFSGSLSLIRLKIAQLSLFIVTAYSYIFQINTCLKTFLFIDDILDSTHITEYLNVMLFFS